MSRPLPVLRRPFDQVQDLFEDGLGRIQQLDQLLDQWFYPRRWRADLHEPNPFYLLEKLWTANGQGVTLYEGIAPKYANYDVFRNLVTRLVGMTLPHAGLLTVAMSSRAAMAGGLTRGYFGKLPKSRSKWPHRWVTWPLNCTFLL